MAEKKSNKPRVVCCIGDIHGYITKLQNLWSNLENLIGPADFQTARIIFLGDYCDRGPDTKKVIDFLISLPLKYPKQSHVFLCGNHDFAFAAFLGLLPSPPDGSSFSETWKEYEMNETKEGWYRGEGYENMHLQGRRWAGRMIGFNHAKNTEYNGSIYDARPTFESYGVQHGSAGINFALLYGVCWICYCWALKMFSFVSNIYESWKLWLCWIGFVECRIRLYVLSLLLHWVILLD